MTPRERLQLPVQWQDGARGWTRDISPEGAYVVVPGEHIVTRWCALEIGYVGRLRLRALAQVLRLESLPEGLGIALHFHDVRIETTW
ncbi:MAG: PilZ domain-containing protein [Comamonadaceae bacterium]|nr:MAG: PilZ domain-containing protein [Comamonadaceae bacterium]